jgi:hypothetical protein
VFKALLTKCLPEIAIANIMGHCITSREDDTGKLLESKEPDKGPLAMILVYFTSSPSLLLDDMPHAIVFAVGRAVPAHQA